MSNTLVVTNTNDRGTGSLREAIENAQSGDTIKFAAQLANRTITLNSELSIAADKNLIVDGQDASNLTISGNDRTRIFYLESTSATPTDLTVKNLTLADGYTSDRGGAISATHQGTVNVENVDFENNVANLGGGAIYTAFESNLTVTESRFEGNKATAGNDERGGGAIAFWGPNDLTITDSEFIDNEGINGGAINSLNGNMTIQDSQFIDNQTTAAFYDSGNANPYLRGFGGAVFADRASASNDSDGGAIEIFNSTFEGNQGKGEGGAAYLYTGGRDRVEIDQSVFEDNQVSALPNGGNDGNGGGVVVMSNEVNRGLTITDSSFANNIAANQGGALWMMNSPTKIDNVTFSGNRAESLETSGNGGAMALYGPTEITNSTIANNYAGWVGGGISADDSPVSVKNTIFYQNTASNGTEDWGIQQHTNRALTDNGNNLQYPAKKTNNFNDTNATESITIADPKLEPLNEPTIATTSDLLQSSGERDSLSGGADNVLVGATNSDPLTGDADTDRFNLLSAKDESDTTAVFGNGLISETDNQFIYNQTDALLSTNSDGTRSPSEVEIATFNNFSSLTNTDSITS